MEWRLQRGRPFVWFAMAAAFALAFAATLETAFGVTGLSWVNGADMIAGQALILSVLAIVAAAGVIGEATCRDRSYETEETLLGTGAAPRVISLARFVVAFAILLAICAMFIPGMVLGALVPFIPPERIGPFVPGHYLRAMAIYVLPNLFLMSALIYAVTARWRSPTAGFIVALGLIALYVTALMLLGRDIYRHDMFALVALLDPYGNIAGAEHSMTWTVARGNIEFRPFSGLILWNRILWLGIAGLLLGLGCMGTPRFLQRPVAKQPRPRQTKAGSRGRSRHILHELTLWELKALWRQPGILLLMGFAALSLWSAAMGTVTYSYSLPTTDLLIHNSGFYFDKVLVLLLVWYAADIVWREHQYRVDEIVDATPLPDIWRLGSKTLALMIVVLGFWALSILVNVAYQISRGYFEFEPGLYFTDIFLFKAPYYLWMTILAVAAQVIVRQRYLAIALVLLVYLSPALFDAFGLYHALYRFGETSFGWYSMMDGYGHFWRAHLWFLAYWSLGAGLIWMLAWGCYGRGPDAPPRRVLWRQRLWAPRPRRLFLGGVAAFAATGAAIFYQTTVLHPWPLLDEARYAAQIEARYRGAWADVPQPKITAITGQIDLYPQERRVAATGAVTLTNFSDAPIDRLLVLFHPHLKEVALAPGAAAILDQEASDSHVQIWHLSTPLAPGASLDLGFTTAGYPDPGFAVHNQHDMIPEVHWAEIVGNGSSILNLNLLPAFGYSERLEHKPGWLRARFGLPREWAPPAATLGADVAHDTTHLAWVERVDMRVSTSADQIPLHSGARVQDLGIIDGRRVMRYSMHQPSRGWAEVMSGRYGIHRTERPGLPAVELYHHPRHDHVLEPMAAALLEGMAYFQARYGPPPFQTFRMAEAALHYNGLGARGGLAFVSEILGWKTDQRLSKGQIIEEYAAQFVGQSWWLDQIIPANLPGAKSVLTGLPYWSAALYLHHSRGPERSREIRLQDMLESYRHRAELKDQELPFAQEMKHSGMIREKGALQIIYLAELVGQARLEAALGAFLDSWRFQGPPYPSVEDLIAHLEASLPEAQGQIEDLFRHITNWDIAVDSARAWPIGDGQWQLVAEMSARKLHTDGNGIEASVELDTPLPFAVFASDGFDPASVLTHGWQSLPGGAGRLELVLSQKPHQIGLDPYLYLPDPNPHDNVRQIELLDRAP